MKLLICVKELRLDLFDFSKTNRVEFRWCRLQRGLLCSRAQLRDPSVNILHIYCAYMYLHIYDVHICCASIVVLICTREREREKERDRERERVFDGK